MPKLAPLDLIVPGTPADVAEALKEQTFFRPFPTRGPGPMRLSQKPLGGRVTQGGFNVSLYRPSWFNLTEPVAWATLSATPSGTRVQGAIGLHPWVTTYLRLATVAVVLGCLGAGGVAVATAAPTAAFLAIAAAFLMILVLSIGVNVANADARVEALDQVVRAALRTGPQPTAQPLGDADPDLLRAAEAELDALDPQSPPRQPEGPAGS